MIERELEVYWSPVARCWRIEDRERFTYYMLTQVVGHLRDRSARALVRIPQNDGEVALRDALLAANIPVAYHLGG